MTKNFKLRIKIYERGITQTELSKRTEISRGYINGALSGRINLPPEEKEKIAHVLRCKV